MKIHFEIMHDILAAPIRELAECLECRNRILIKNIHIICSVERAGCELEISCACGNIMSGQVEIEIHGGYIPKQPVQLNEINKIMSGIRKTGGYLKPLL